MAARGIKSCRPSQRGNVGRLREQIAIHGRGFLPRHAACPGGGVAGLGYLCSMIDVAESSRGEADTSSTMSMMLDKTSPRTLRQQSSICLWSNDLPTVLPLAAISILEPSGTSPVGP